MVQLFVTQVEFGGEMVDTIRVRAPRGGAAAAKLSSRPVELEPEAAALDDEAILF